MPLFELKCLECSNALQDDCVFSEFSSLSALPEVPCPTCGKTGCERVYTAPAIHEGRTASQKISGTTKQRIEYGKFLRDQRSIRKANHDPNSREGASNELWLGNEDLKGIVSGPTKKAK